MVLVRKHDLAGGESNPTALRYPRGYVTAFGVFFFLRHADKREGLSRDRLLPNGEKRGTSNRYILGRSPVPSTSDRSSGFE